MQFNPNDEIHIARLRRHMESSLDTKEPFIKNRKAALKEYVGSNYSDSGSDKAVPVNYIELAINLYRRLLVPDTPRVAVTSHFREFRPSAVNFQLALDYSFDKLKFGVSLQEVVMEAMFSMGAMKVGVTSPEFNEQMGWRHDGGMVFADPISFENWIHDFTATRWEEVQYVGDKYQMSYDFVMDSAEFTNKGDLRPLVDDDARGKEKGTVARDLRARELSQNRNHHYNDADLSDRVDLWDLWLPHEGLFITLSAHQEQLKPLRVVEWFGPEEGPYHRMWFTPVPDNVMPLPPVSQWMDLHHTLNTSYRKLTRQAERQKEVLVTARGDEAGATKYTQADDGAAISIQNPEGLKSVRSGGIDQPQMAFALQTKQLFSMIAGNIEVLGGFGGSETLGQDKLMNSNASQRLSDMQEVVGNFIEGVSRSIGWHLWNDPSINIPLTKKIPGSEIEIDIEWNEQKKAGDFNAYNLKFEPYSSHHKSPGERMAMVNQTVMNIVMPMMGQLQQQGIQFDMQSYLKMMARYTDMPELSELIVVAGGDLTGSPISTGGGGESGEEGGIQRREVVRRNVPTGGTQQSQEAALMQILSGGQPNGDQVDAMGRGMSGMN